MNCDTCRRVIDPETDRHAVVREQLIAPDLGAQTTAGKVLCEVCADVSDARLAPR